MEKFIRPLAFFLLLAICLISVASCVKPNEDTPQTDIEGDSESESTSDEKSTETDAETTEIQNIRPISPAIGHNVRLVNNNIYEWWKGYKFERSDFSKYSLKKDLYYPVPVTLSFEVAESADYYRLSISRNSDMSDSDQYLLSEPSLTLEHLFTGTDYYWQVDAVYENKILRSTIYTFSTEEGPRAIRIDGVSNTRDIGGIACGSEYRIKQGLIYRGGALENITDEGREYMVNVLGIKTDMDVRNALGEDAKSPLGENINYYSFSGRCYIGGTMGIDTDEGKKIMADEIRVFANPENYPIYLHCSLGRDRTGSLIMLIEGLLGAKKNNLALDYELSAFSATGTSDDAAQGVYRNCVNSIYNYIDTSYEGKNFSNKVENYMLDIGITAEEIASIKTIMLEEVK